MSVTTVQHALSPYKDDSTSSTVHCTEYTYTSIMSRETKCYNTSPCFPLLPISPLEHCAPLLSPSILSFAKATNNREIVQSIFLDLIEDMAVFSQPVLPNNVLKAIMDKNFRKFRQWSGLTQSWLFQHWLKTHEYIFHLYLAAGDALHNAVLVGLDVEAYDYDQSYITELELSILDPLKAPT
jgi:hypothetical protein